MKQSPADNTPDHDQLAPFVLILALLKIMPADPAHLDVDGLIEAIHLVEQLHEDALHLPAMQASQLNIGLCLQTHLLHLACLQGACEACMSTCRTSQTGARQTNQACPVALPSQCWLAD